MNRECLAIAKNMQEEAQRRREAMPPCRFERASASVFGDADEQPEPRINTNQACEDAGHDPKDFV